VVDVYYLAFFQQKPTKKIEFSPILKKDNTYWKIKVKRLEMSMEISPSLATMGTGTA
jgi:hypothetical protein